jgi:hypothetical protein
MNARLSIALAMVVAVAAGVPLLIDEPLRSSMASQTTPKPRALVAQPFSNTSIWNTPIGSGAQYRDADDPETKLLRSKDAGGPGGSYTWVATDTFSVYRTDASDELATWHYDSRSATAPWPLAGPIRSGSVSIPTPPQVEFGGGTDRWAVLIMPDGRTAYEMWKGSRNPVTGDYHARYLVRTDLAGSGIASADGRSEGIRAFGGSLFGGLIRCRELERGEIPHAVAMLLSATQLRKGATMNDQKVWPATTTDRGGDNKYSGLVPMGALVAIRPDVDLDSLGLTREGLALARAYQRFGAYVVDQAVDTMTIAAVEKGCRSAVLAPLFKDRAKLLAHLVRVTNNAPDAIGGGGSRMAAPPPPPEQRAVGRY